MRNENYVTVTGFDGDLTVYEITNEQELGIALTRLEITTDAFLELPFWRIFKRIELRNKIKEILKHIQKIK